MPDPTRFLDQITVICSDIWKAYLTVIGKRLPTAVHILDRFHIMQHFSKALDKVRAEEARRLKERGQDPVLSKSRWCFLKRKEKPQRLPGHEVVRASEDEPAHGQSLPAQGGLPALLELHLPRVGRIVSPALVFAYDEKQHRTDERHRQDAAASSRAHPQLVQGQEAVQQRHCRGLEPEMESDGEKSIRIPHLQGTANRFIPSAWRFTRATIHPRILLTSRIEITERRTSRSLLFSREKAACHIGHRRSGSMRML